MARLVDRRGVYRILVERPKGKRPLGRYRRMWQASIKMDRQEVGWGGIGWIDLVEDRDRCWVLVNAVMNLQFP
jgi:hypothetical protein